MLEFVNLVAAGIDYVQPSAIKNGITAQWEICRTAEAGGATCLPHSPYFGPGLLATLQLLALRDDATFVEIFYMKRAANLWRGRVDVDENGNVEVPEGPGLGYEPDREVMEQYRVS